MLYVAYRVGYDNMVGLIGVAALAEVDEKITDFLFEDEDVADIRRIGILQEGRLYHVEGTIELRKGLTLVEADDIKFRLRNKLLHRPEIADVVLGIIEDDDKKTWQKLQ